MGMRNNEAAGTDLLQAESFKCGATEIKKNKTEIVNKM